MLFRLWKVAFEAEIGMFEREKTHAFFEKISGLNPFIKPGFHMVVSVVSVVSVVRKKFIAQIEFILSRSKSYICRFFCIEHLYGRFP